MMEDQTKAKALELAEKKLVQLGYRFSVEDIGFHAAKMLKVFERELRKQD